MVTIYDINSDSSYDDYVLTQADLREAYARGKVAGTTGDIPDYVNDWPEDLQGVFYQGYGEGQGISITATLYSNLLGLTSIGLKTLGLFKNILPEIPAVTWKMVDEAILTMTEEQIKNLQRFIDKLPSNSENIRVKDFIDGGKIFQGDSPAQSIPGSYATYEKQIDKNGDTILYFKTIYGPENEIIHIAPKFPSGSKIYPEPNITPSSEYKMR